MPNTDSKTHRFREVYRPTVSARQRQRITRRIRATQLPISGTTAALIPICTLMSTAALSQLDNIVTGAFGVTTDTVIAVTLLTLLAAIGAAGWWAHDHIPVADRWRNHVIPGPQLDQAAAKHPDLDQRLRRLQNLTDTIRQRPAVRDGWLPSINPAALDDIEWTITSHLMETVPTRDALAAASGRPALTALAAQHQQQITDADNEADSQLDQLDRIDAAARRIEEHLQDLTLADQLAGTAITRQLRASQPSPTGTELTDRLAAIDAAEDIIRAGLPTPQANTDETN